MDYEKAAENWLKNCSDHRGEQILSLAELLAVCANEALERFAAKWHKEALALVPPEYAKRNLHQKYLKLDNEAAGIDACADELDAHIALKAEG